MAQICLHFWWEHFWASQTEDPFTIIFCPWELLITRQSISNEANKNWCFHRVLSLVQQSASFVFSNPKERFLFYDLAFCTCMSFKIHNIPQQMASKQGMLVQGSSSETRQRHSPVSSTYFLWIFIRWQVFISGTFPLGRLAHRPCKAMFYCAPAENHQEFKELPLTQDVVPKWFFATTT